MQIDKEESQKTEKKIKQTNKTQTVIKEKGHICNNYIKCSVNYTCINKYKY